MYKSILLLSLSFSTLTYSMDWGRGDDSSSAFQKKYMDHYFPAVEMDQASLVESAPAELKQWFEGVGRNEETNPVLLYGAYGVGKTMTSQALTREVDCSLCYLGMPQEMRWDSSDRFDKRHLAGVNQNTCVVVDNIYNLQEDDVENLSSLVDACNAQRNLHLLAIAYHAKSKMPVALYNKFRSIKFPVPAPQDRLSLFKYLFREKRLADDVDEAFLKSFNGELSNFTARDIESLRILVSLKSHRDDHEAGPPAVSRSYLEKGLKTLKKNLERMKFVFEECE